MINKNYGGLIWTNHAIFRLQQRNINQGDAWSVWRNPDSSEYDKDKGVWVYQRTYGKEMIEIVCKKDEKGKWIILSVWSKPVRKVTPKTPLLIKIFKNLFFR
jgi:hypothetical protein